MDLPSPTASASTSKFASLPRSFRSIQTYGTASLSTTPSPASRRQRSQGSDWYGSHHRTSPLPIPSPISHDTRNRRRPSRSAVVDQNNEDHRDGEGDWTDRAVEQAQREGNSESWNVLNAILPREGSIMGSMPSTHSLRQSRSSLSDHRYGTAGAVPVSPQSVASACFPKPATRWITGQAHETSPHSDGRLKSKKSFPSNLGASSSSTKGIQPAAEHSPFVEEPISYQVTDLDPDQSNLSIGEVDTASSSKCTHIKVERIRSSAQLVSDSESDEDMEGNLSTYPQVDEGYRHGRNKYPDEQKWRAKFKLPTLTIVQKNVVKCVVAYFLAELFTFVPVLAELVGAPWDVEGPIKNAHVIATVAVYFNPAKTLGAMIEADLYMIIGALYASFLCCGSMGMSVIFDRYGYQNVGHAIVLVFWMGVGFGLLAFVKVKVNKPTFSTACSMVSLISSVIITKEGAFHIGQFQSRAILQILIIVAIGSLISNVVCFVIWPTSATSKLQIDMNKTLSSFSMLLDMLTKTFLLEDDNNTRPESLKKAIDAHQASFTTLKASLSQARFERLDSRIQATAFAYQDAVESMTRLAQGLTGLRSGCTLQYEIVVARREEDEKSRDPALNQGPRVLEDQLKHKALMDDLILLEDFKEKIGPHLKDLARTSKQTIALLRTSFVHTKMGSSSGNAVHSNDDPCEADVEAVLFSPSLLKLKEELEQGLLLFKRVHSKAIKYVYQQLPSKELPPNGNGGNVLADDKDNLHDKGPNDSLFRIYYFCFNFEEWVKELVCLVEAFAVIRAREEYVERRHRERRQRWGIFASIYYPFRLQRPRAEHGKFSGVGLHDNGKPSLLKEAIGIRSSKKKSKQRPFPSIVDGSLTSHLVGTEVASSRAKIKQWIWKLGWHLRDKNLRFAIKTGLGVTILASAAFIPSLRPLWLKWRGEWALISYMVIMSPTLGGTNFLAFGRILGTLVGALAGVACYSAFPENPFVLPLLGALFSAPCFYVIVTRPEYGPSGRFLLLTFNLICLYAYNLREVDTHVLSVAFHRSSSVAFGILFGLIVTSWIWPVEARRELRTGLSEFFLNAAYLYERLVRMYSIPPAELVRSERHRSPSQLQLPHEGTTLLSAEARRSLDDAVEDFVGMELYLQLSLIKLSGLLSATAHEPRLKGPFPISEYRTVLASCQTMLDLLTSMRTVTTRETWYTSVRRDFVIPVNKERREMVGNVLLYFSVLASALSLKTPLPAYLPPAAEARERLIAKMRQLEVVKRRIVRGGSDSLLYLAYTITMKDVIAQLDNLGRTFQELFGVTGGACSTAEFEALFAVGDEDVLQAETLRQRDNNSDSE